MGSLKLYQRAQRFRYLSFGLAAIVCGLLAQPALALFCLLWPLLLHQGLPRLLWVQHLATGWSWRALLALVHLFEAALVSAQFIGAQFSLTPLTCALLALLAAAIAQGGIRLCVGVLLVIAATILLMDVGYLLAELAAVELASVVAVIMSAALALALAHAGFGRALHIHRSRLRWRHEGQRYQLLSDRLSRYVPTPLLQRLAQLGPSQADPQWQAPLTWQRRWLTLVVVDLVSFTELSRSLPAEHCALVLNRFLLAIDQLAAEQGASLARFMGDGALLVWGDPVSEPPLTQILHACDLCNRLPSSLQAAEQFCAAKGAPVQLRARAAITSGYCTVGDWGGDYERESSSARLDYTVIGPSVNLAQRLQHYAPHNGALLDEASAAILATATATTTSRAGSETLADVAACRSPLGPEQWLDLKGFGRVRAFGLVGEF